MEQLKGVEDREMGWSEWTRTVGRVGGGVRWLCIAERYERRVLFALIRGNIQLNKFGLVNGARP
jgi:hypothetical protein